VFRVFKKSKICIFLIAFLQLIISTPPVNSAPLGLTFVVNDASSDVAGGPITGYVQLIYLAQNAQDIANVEMFLKVRPNGSSETVLTSGSGTAVPDVVPGKVSFYLNPSISPTVPGQYVYVVSVTFPNNPELNTSRLLTFTLNQPVVITPTPTPTPTPTQNALIPTTVVIEPPTQYTANSNGKPVYQVNLDANGQANAQVMAYVQPVDLSKLPPGRSSLDVELIFKGSGGPGCPVQPVQTIGTYKEGYKFFFLNYKLNSTGSCTGTFQFYGDSIYEKTNYPTFTFNVLPYVNLSEITIGEVSLYSQSVAPGGIATIYYFVKNPKLQGTAGLGAGIGNFGVDTGPFGDEYSSIGWTLGMVKGDPVGGVYKSNIPIPLTAKPGTYKTYAFWKGVTGPVYGPDITILDPSSTSKSDLQIACQNQSAATAASLKESDSQLSDLSRRITNLSSLNSVERQIEYESITSNLKSIAVNLSTWISKLPVYLSSNSDCTDFSKQLTYANALYSNLNAYSIDLNKLAVESLSKPTYINFTFTGNNQSLNGENLYLDGIDSTGDGRGSIEINAFLKASDSKLMFGNQSLNYKIVATNNTPKICKISTPKYFLGTDNPFTKFSLTPLSEGKCSLIFTGSISDRKDLTSASTAWVVNVRASASGNGKDISTELNSDGVEVDPSANLSVAKLSNGKFIISVDSNLESEDVEIYASKKGAKTIKFLANTGASTQLKITTTRNLKGYTLLIKYSGAILDKYVVK
jgi:hypothetical protein